MPRPPQPVRELAEDIAAREGRAKPRRGDFAEARERIEAMKQPQPEPRVLDLVDMETGEVLREGQGAALVAPDGAVWEVRQRVQTKRTMNGGFYMQSTLHDAEQLLTGLTPREAQVWVHLMLRVQYGNLVRVNKSALARRLDIDSETVRRAVLRLVDRGILAPDPDAAPGRAITYIVNPTCAMRGTPDQRDRAQETYSDWAAECRMDEEVRDRRREERRRLREELRLPQEVDEPRTED